MDYSQKLDLSTIPDDALRSEWARRNSLRRTVFGGGRPPVTVACWFCGNLYNSSDLRAHQPGCRQGKLRELISAPWMVAIVPTFDDLNGLGFIPVSLTREMFVIQKRGYQNQALVPTRAIRNILIPRDRSHLATVAVAGDLRFDKNKGEWTFEAKTYPNVHL